MGSVSRDPCVAVDSLGLVLLAVGGYPEPASADEVEGTVDPTVTDACTTGFDAAIRSSSSLSLSRRLAEGSPAASPSCGRFMP